MTDSTKQNFKSVNAKQQQKQNIVFERELEQSPALCYILTQIGTKNVWFH